MSAISVGAALVLIAGFVLAGCSGGGKKSPGDGSSGDAPTRVPVMVPGTDAVVLPLNAAQATDAIELARLTGYTSVACSTDPSAPGSEAPPCREGEDNGRKVDALARLSCEGSWVRPELVPGEYQTAMIGGPKLFAVYVPKRVNGSFGGDLGVEQVLVMQSGTRLDGSTNGFALHTKNGRVVLLQTPCDSFLQLVNADVVGSYIVVDPTKVASPAAQ